MSDIMGSVTTLKKFLEKKETKVTCNNEGGETKVLFSLPENRIYVIPKYQREIRWKCENLIELMTDIKKGAKFLGNIILSKDNNIYNIIDGQQRTTTLLMLFQYIKYKYSSVNQTIDTCTLKIESFADFDILLSSNFENVNNLFNSIRKTDDYNQMDRYIALWNDINSSEILSDKFIAKDFFENMEKCEINIIISESSEYAIDYFLDVNLKGLKLDNEDIFKSYLFAQNKSIEMYQVWMELKKTAEILEKNKIKYPLMKIIEHFFYCDLFKHEEYTKIEFDQNFLLTNKFKIGSRQFYKGQHILKVIQDNSYMVSSLSRVTEFLKYIVDIVTNGYSYYFNNFFNDNCSFDNVEKQIIYSIIKNIIMDTNKVPKVLIMKYMLEILNSSEDVERKQYKYIYVVYALATYFNIFETQKSSDIIYDIVKKEKWSEAASSQLEKYFDNSINETLTVNFLYKYHAGGKIDEIQSFRCKSLASIYNFINLDNMISLKKGKTKEFNEFINNRSIYSLEHFIINDCEKCETELNGIKFVYEYPKEIQSYKNSITNYIFISEKLNNSIGNKYILGKIEHLNNKDIIDSEKCNYSKKIIDIVSKNFSFPSLNGIVDEIEAKDILDTYYLSKFRNEYLKYSKVVMEELSKKE